MTEFRELYVDERIDQSEELRLEVARDSAKADLLEVDGELTIDDRRYIITEVEDVRRGTELLRSAIAVGAWSELGDKVRGGSFTYVAATIAELLDAALAGTGWTAGPATSTSTDTFDIDVQDSTVLGLIRTIARITGTFAVFTTVDRVVELADSRGRQLGTAFRYGRNVNGVRRRTSPPAATVLYAYGADGLTFAGINSGKQYVEDFSYYTDAGLTIDEAREFHTRERIVSDGEFLDEAALLAYATELIADLAQPTTSYELDVVDLTELTGLGEKLRLGDTVRVFDPDLGDDRRAIVVRLLRYPYEPHRDRVELAYILPIVDPAGSSSRPSTSEQWVQFIQNNVAEQRVRNDQLYYVNRLPLTFRQGGRANYHLDVDYVGVGAGTVSFELYDAIGDVVLHEFEATYADGVRGHESHTLALEELAESYDYRVRVQTTADGGPSTTNGITIPEDALKFYILAQGAIRQTPTTTTSERFDWNGVSNKTDGTAQPFQVPDGVTELTVTVVGAGGADTSTTPTDAGPGALLKCIVPVTPGEILDVYAAATGSQGLDPYLGGWPNGGNGRTGSTGNTNAPGGGGSSYIVRTGGAFADALIVAAGGGGRGDLNYRGGGQGGIFEGGDGDGTGISSSHRQGLGATQFAGGIGGDADDDTDGSFGQGGNAGISTSSFSFGGGGGGGGWYGGGGGGDPVGLGSTGDAGGGGGGSSWWAPASVIPVELTDGGGSGPDTDGYVLIEWELPD